MVPVQFVWDFPEKVGEQVGAGQLDCPHDRSFARLVQDCRVRHLQKYLFSHPKPTKNCVVHKKSPTGGGKSVALGLQPPHDCAIHD
jgi:hypothetical protein